MHTDKPTEPLTHLGGFLGIINPCVYKGKNDMTDRDC